jgi:hypothetical protein
MKKGSELNIECSTPDQQHCHIAVVAVVNWKSHKAACFSSKLIPIYPNILRIRHNVLEYSFDFIDSLQSPHLLMSTPP